MVKSMGTVAITGDSGYIGEHLVAQLRDLGNVRIRVLSSSKGLQPGVSEFGAGLEVVEGDLHVPDSISSFLEPGCTVVHLAYLQGGAKPKIWPLLPTCSKRAGLRMFDASFTAAQLRW